MSKTMTFETTARTIGECFPYIKNGANIKQAKEGKGIPITRIETISGGTFHRDRMGYANIHDTEKYKNWILHDGDILMSHINSIPNMGRAVEYKAEEGETIIHGMNLLALRADRTIVIPGYADIYFSSTIFRNYVFRITKKAVNQASFSIKDLKTIPIPLPSLEAQRAIAQQFTQINALHRALLQKTDCLDAVTKSRFVEMFGDITEQYLLGERLETTSGGTPSRKHPEYYEGGSIPWLTSGEVNKGKIDTPNHFITEAGLRNSSAKLVPANSVVVAMYGATAGQVGLVTYETTTNQAVCCIKPNAQVVPVFLRYALEFKKDWMINQCAGGAR